MSDFMTENGITLLDRSMKIDEIRIIKSHAEILGFNIENKTGRHLFIEPIFDNSNNLIRLKINTEWNL